VIKTAEALLPGMAVSYTAINWHTANGCIDDGQNLVRSWPCNGTEPQAFWGVDTIKGNGSYLIAENGKHCLDAPSSKNWSDLVDGPCSLHYFRERWYFDYGPTGNFILRNQVSGKCLQDGNDQPYVRMSVYTCNGSRSQQVWPYYSGKFQ
ncbi:MAG: RICIN domain-containing protein, partial [Nitrososphaerales archaeon]